MRKFLFKLEGERAPYTRTVASNTMTNRWWLCGGMSEVREMGKGR